MPEIVIFFNKIANWNFVEKKDNFLQFFWKKMSSLWQFLDRQMAIFRSVKCWLTRFSMDLDSLLVPIVLLPLVLVTGVSGDNEIILWGTLRRSGVVVVSEKKLPLSDMVSVYCWGPETCWVSRYRKQRPPQRLVVEGIPNVITSLHAFFVTFFYRPGILKFQPFVYYVWSHNINKSMVLLEKVWTF